MPSPATILAFDCACGPCTVAVWKDGKTLAFREETAPGKQSARLVGLIEEALKETGIWYDALDTVVTTVGPGSFTGIRIGLAAAKGIELASSVKAVGVTTLEALAYSFLHRREIVALLNAGKGQAYAQRFGSEISKPELVDLDRLAEYIGDAQAVGNVGCEHVTLPDARVMATMVAGGAQTLPLTPYYIRPPDAKPQKLGISSDF